MLMSMKATKRSTFNAGSTKPIFPYSAEISIPSPSLPYIPNLGISSSHFPFDFSTISTTLFR
ncbi:hypothetical protein Hanom_Chr14g01310631 [Helianthus anomalus]